MSLEIDLASWASRIRPHLNNAVDSLLSAGQQLLEAKAALPHGAFGPLLEELGLSRQMANRFMRVAANPVFANCSQVGALPPAVSVLDVLTRLDDDELQAAIETGQVSASTTRADAEHLVELHRLERIIDTGLDTMRGALEQVIGRPATDDEVIDAFITSDGQPRSVAAVLAHLSVGS
jgi:hypothetical protein